MDKKYVAAVVKCAGREGKATCLVYEVKGDPTARPKLIQHEDDRKRARSDISFTSTAFSADSRLLACVCSNSAVGVLIYDWELEKHISTLPTTTRIVQVSFNPKNSTKLCVTGGSGTFQFWHYGPHSAHVAPIEGLPTGAHTLSYTCHSWISPNCVIAGSTLGDLVLVIGVHQQQRISAFNSDALNAEQIHSPLLKFLIRGSKLVCLSSDNYISIFDIKQVDPTSGQHETLYSLHLSSRFRFGKIDAVIGAEWNMVDNSRDFSVTVASKCCINQYDIRVIDLLVYDEEKTESSENVDHPSAKAGLLAAAEPAAADASQANNSIVRRAKSPPGGHRVSFLRAPASRKEEASAFRWGYLRPAKVLSRMHHGDIVSLGMSKRTSVIATSSVIDKCVRVWDYNMVKDSELLVEEFTFSATEIPNSIDLHPSGTIACCQCVCANAFCIYISLTVLLFLLILFPGLYMYAGNEDFAVEYAITNNKLEMTRKVPTKLALTTPAGEPFVNTSPVSLVKYSHGGHIIAVVTGRLVQLFHLYNLDYTADKSGRWCPIGIYVTLLYSIAGSFTLLRAV
jgi:hypothetical protein